ncbi:MAG TPA: carboxylate-amine ligase [Alphaproteobacteria bacterium]|nr:carboxylate-amine ligase [Alphaproteobacteria bacterium]
MPTPIPAFSLGIEEEYLLVDRTTGDLVPDPPPSLMAEAAELLPGQVNPEFLRCQIEIGTTKCATIAQARDDLRRLRAAVVNVAGRHGLAPIAAATHPFAGWAPQKHTDRERYSNLARDLGAPARRLVICGLHVHAGIEDPELRVDLMNQVRYFLPHLLSLTTSSPFWRGVDSGLMSYRLAVLNELPRTGTPEAFASWGDFQRHLGVLVDAGVIEDGTKLWWDVRPSVRFPTLEMRITDVPTRFEDSLTVAALYLCLLRLCYRLRVGNVTWRRYAQMLLEENRWRAQRYGLDAGLVDFGRGEVVPYADLLEEMIALVREDAEALGCTQEVLNARDILRRGTSAHRQRDIYQKAVAAGATPDAALREVVQWLVAETAHGL